MHASWYRKVTPRPSHSWYIQLMSTELCKWTNICWVKSFPHFSVFYSLKYGFFLLFKNVFPRCVGRRKNNLFICAHISIKHNTEPDLILAFFQHGARPFLWAFVCATAHFDWSTQGDSFPYSFGIPSWIVVKNSNWHGIQTFVKQWSETSLFEIVLTFW